MNDYNKRNMEPTNTEPDAVERRANYREITGSTYNALNGALAVLMLIFQHLEGDSIEPVTDPEIKCYRDVLVLNRNMAEGILTIVNQISEVIGVG